MISIQGIKKRFGEHEILKGVDLEIPPNKITVILGQSGQGKSVLLKMIMGLLTPDHGNILLQGQDLRDLGHDDRSQYAKKIGMLFQNAALFDSMNVEENVAFPLREHTKYSDAVIRETLETMLNDLGLPDIYQKMPAELSGGMRKRVGLARALVLKPEIMLYDEPTTGLDPILADSVDQLILNTGQKFGITSVVVSHDIEAAFKIADKIALLHEGVILEEGKPEEFRKSKKPFVQQFILGKAGEGFIG